MTTNQILTLIFEICIIPLLAALTKYLVAWIKAKADNIKQSTDSELYKKYIDLLETTVTDAVLMVSQTYVDALKEQGNFGLEEQKIAFQTAFDAVKQNLSEEAFNYLNEVTSDLDAYINTLIEATIAKTKLTFQT